tara:strand:- start:6995 stop:7201 length:207 start_codon:yes stop_codon:yes gene_type:complete
MVASCLLLAAMARAIFNALIIAATQHGGLLAFNHAHDRGFQRPTEFLVRHHMPTAGRAGKKTAVCDSG